MSSVLVSACVFGPAGNPVGDDEFVDPDEPNNTRQSVDCADCTPTLVTRSPTSKPGISRVCPEDARFAFSFAAYPSDSGVRAAGVRCTDAAVVWDDDAFILARGENLQDLDVVGTTADRLPSPSTCREGFAIGLEVQTKEGRVANISTLCSEFSFRVVRDIDGALSSELTRTPVEAGPVAPGENCADDGCTDPLALECPDDSIAIAVVANLDGTAAKLDEIDVLCAPVSLRVEE